jgi:predicted GNAT superfamily acetyltransferase
VSSRIVEWKAGNKNLYIRDLCTMEDYKEVERIQIEAWGFSELDVVPSGQLIAARWAGAILLGAFDSERMIGFVYGFPALEAGSLSLHSHMLGVRPESRKLHAGIYLKLAQRIKALELGLDEITWTFDPLQVLNANLNFGRLGVISNRYIVNFYGEETSSHLHRGLGTDRLWVRWLISTDRVKHRIALVCSEPTRSQQRAESSVLDRLPDPYPLLDRQGPLVLVKSSDAWHPLIESGHSAESDACLIEIPADVAALKQSKIELAERWRSRVQSAFLESFASGFVAREFVSLGSASGARWFYLLRRDGRNSAA